MFNLFKLDFILFSFIGLFNTAIHFFVYTILVFLHVPYLLANIIGYVVGMINSYILNKHYVFGQKKHNSKYLLKFIMVNTLTLTIHSLLLYYSVSILGFNEIFSQAFVTCISLTINYTGNKLWTFK